MIEVTFAGSIKGHAVAYEIELPMPPAKGDGVAIPDDDGICGDSGWMDVKVSSVEWVLGSPLSVICGIVESDDDA